MEIIEGILIIGASVGTGLLGLIFPVNSKTSLLHSFMQRVGIILIAAGGVMLFAVWNIKALELITALVVLALGDGLVVWSLYFRHTHCKPWRQKSRAS